MSENMGIDELRTQLEIAEGNWAHFESKSILLERQANEQNGVLLRFRALFGKDAMPEAIQERLERAATLKTAAEQQCERIRQTKIDESPLAVGIFTLLLKQPYAYRGPGSTWEERIRAAIAGTQQAMGMIVDAGGLGDPRSSEANVALLKDEIGGLRQRIADDDAAGRENHECLSKIIGARTERLRETEGNMRWLVKVLRSQIEEFRRRTIRGHPGYTIAPTVCDALRKTLDRFESSGEKQPAEDDANDCSPRRPAAPTTPRTGCSWCGDTGEIGPEDDRYACPCPAGQLVAMRVGMQTLQAAIDEARLLWAFAYDDGSPDVCTVPSAWRHLARRFGEAEANRLVPDGVLLARIRRCGCSEPNHRPECEFHDSEAASGEKPPAGDDPDRLADPSTPGTPSDLPGSEQGAVLPPEADEDVPF